MAATEAEIKAIIKYNSRAIRRFAFGLNRFTEPDLLSWLESKQNVQGYIKELIRKDMEKQGKLKLLPASKHPPLTCIRFALIEENQKAETDKSNVIR